MADIHGFELNALDIKCVQQTFSLQQIRDDAEYQASYRIGCLRRIANLANDLADELIHEVETPVSGVPE